MTVSAQQRYVGGDISLLPTYEKNGAWWNDAENQHITNMLQYLKDQGLTSLRVRLFVDPSKAHQAHKMQGVRQDLAYVKELGRRIKEAGFTFLLDFHYSDSWADPSMQFTPDAWLSLTDEQLYTKIYDYTRDCLELLVAAGATPDFIQTGNEISYGMLWGKGVKTKDTYNASSGKGDLEYSNNDASYKQCFYDDRHEANWQRFITLLKQAGKACREVCPEAKIILHSERVPRPANIGNFMQRMQEGGVDYDILGLSYYPYHHGSLTQLGLALNQTANYDKDVMIVETGYYYAWEPSTVESSQKSTWPITPQGQAAYVRDLIAYLKDKPRVIGLYWWAMENTENGINDWDNKRVTDGWVNYSLFNDTDNSIWGYGQVMPALAELKAFAEGTGTGVSMTPKGQEQGAANKSAAEHWYSLQGTRYDRRNETKATVTRPRRGGIYIHNGRKIIL
jgi:arabinogalactan endo-1,4-beta-galactosidase